MEGLTETTSQPLLARAWEEGLEGSRVMARMANWEAALGSARMDLMTEPPWFPVAPKTTRSFFAADIFMLLVVGFLVSTRYSM
jgi:hypothetical protein